MVVYWIVLSLAWVLVHILWRVEVIGKENVPRDRAVVLTPNHISDLDPVFVLALLLDWSRYRILAKKELFNLRFQHAINQLDNPMRLKAVKKEIAVIKTIMRENELKSGAEA